MDTIKQAVFGSNNQNDQEPVSGQQGDTSRGEPYDAGNKNDSTNNNTSTDTTGNSAGTSGDNTNTNTNNDNNTNANTDNNRSGNADEPRDDNEAKDSSQHPGDSTGAQNDTRDPSDPETEPKKGAAKSNVDDSGDGPNETDTSGPGPRPVAQLAAEHGGDAGATDGGSGEGGDAGGDDDDGDDDGPQKKSHGHGTGEQYVKSTGLNADGGDFDASKPGAGREADRLLEEKGIHNPTDTSSQPAPAGGEDPLAHKQGLGGKIKEKMMGGKMDH